MSTQHDLVVVGGGIFGTTAALVMRERGYQVALLDPGPLPHPLAASTDISKVVRMEYGADEQYTAMAEAALAGWRYWNELLGQTIYHETGVAMITHSPMQPGGYEYESYQALLKRRREPERLDADEIARRFPAWRPGAFVDGFFHAQGGFAESGRLVVALAQLARRQGVDLREGQKATEIVVAQGQALGVKTESGQFFPAGRVLIAAGAWTPVLLPELAPMMVSTGHPIFHLRPADPDLFAPPRFVVFTADVSRTGWYGFPLHPTEGVVKIANHGVGLPLHPTAGERLVSEADEQRLRAMLAVNCPALSDAPLVYARHCLYCDTLDGDFWIDHHPDIQGLIVAAGGSGHAFKFAPILGDLIADVIELKPHPWTLRFRWREEANTGWGDEARGK